MIIIRPITKKDQDIFVEFSFNSTLGIRNLPRDKIRLEEKIKSSQQAFNQNVKHPHKEEYLFVLEDLSTGRIGGTCGIFASIDPQATYNYRIEKLHIPATHPSAIKEIEILRLAPPMKNVSEICSLYLQPTFRHSGQGRLLSLSRFLFIASHRERFHKKIIAELRGSIDQRQISPFWEALGKHFCDLSFVELMAQLDQKTINIQEILPRYPIYISLLSPEARESIGKTHETSRPALEMLQREGFVFTNQIDALEGGPSIIAPVSKIRSIKNSRLIKISTTKDTLLEDNEFILANTSLDFRACYGTIEFTKNKIQGLINQDVAEALKVKNGDMIRYVTLH